MPIEIANIPLPRVHRVLTQERADFISHRVPGLSGNVVQDMGRQSARLKIEGIFYGKKAKEDLERLRQVYKARKPVDFLADIVGQAYFAQVIIEQLDVQQAAHEPEQFSYQLIVVEYVQPPKSVTGIGKRSIDTKLSGNAKDFMKMVRVPDLLDVPNFGDPSVPLETVKTKVEATLGKAIEPAKSLTTLFDGDKGSEKGVITQVKNIDERVVKNTINDQLTSLDTAGDTAKATQEDVKKETKEAEKALAAIEIPNFDQTAIFIEGFDSIEAALPTDGDVLAEATEGVDKLFENLDKEVVGPLEIVFNALNALSNLNIDTEVIAIGDLEAIETRILTKTDVVLSDTWTAQDLLELLSQQLNAMPREEVPIQNIPVFDELRDKLQIVLGWLNKDSAELSTEFAQNIIALAEYIKTRFFDTTLHPVTQWFTQVVEKSDWTRYKSYFTAIPNSLDELAQLVNKGDLSTADTHIEALSKDIEALEIANQKILDIWVSEEGMKYRDKFEHLDEDLSAEMSHISMLITPSKELDIIGLALSPLNQLLDQAGIDALLNGLTTIFNKVEALVASIDSDTILEFVDKAVKKAVEAIKTLQEVLVKATVKITEVLQKVESTINKLNIAGLIDELKNVLEDFEQLVSRQLMAIFDPIRRLLQAAFGKINGWVAAFDPKLIIDKVVELIQVLTNILKNPQFEWVIKNAKETLARLNEEMNNFSIRPVTTVVIDGIGVVKTGLGVAQRLPMPGSTKQRLNKALNKLPSAQGFRSKVVTKINAGFSTVIDKGARPALLAVKDKPTQLVKLVKNYSPDKYLTDELFAPYQEVVGKMETLKPTVLMQPANAQCDKFREKVKQKLDPVKIFKPLQAPFDKLINTLDELDPEKMIEPLQAKLTEGVNALTDRLPLDKMDSVFSQIDVIVAQIAKGVDAADGVCQRLNKLNDRLEGLKNADAQIADFGKRLAEKLDELTDFESIASALTTLDAVIVEMMHEDLWTSKIQLFETVIKELTQLDAPQLTLVLPIAKQRFPRKALDALPDSQQKQALQMLLDAFNPVTFTTPLNALNVLLLELTSHTKKLETMASTWQKRYNGEQSPFKQFQKKEMTIEEMKTMLKTTIEEQLTTTLIPAFSLVSKFQTVVASLVKHVTDLIKQLEQQIRQLLTIHTNLKQVLEQVNSLVNQIKDVDITFIAKDVKHILEAVTVQLTALNPKDISGLLKKSFDNILNAIDPNTLLGLEALDILHAELITLIKERNPKEALLKPAQAEFDKVVAFLKEFEIQDTVTLFLETVERFRKELKIELNNTADAYEDMVAAISKSFQSQLGQA